MKFFVSLFLSLFFVFNINAAVVENGWNDSYEKELNFYCSEGDYLCFDICGKFEQCKVPEETCHNCIGTSIHLTYIFNYMGKAYTNTGVEANPSSVRDLIRSRRFVSFSSRSIYNHVDSFNSPTLRRNFRSLCSDGTRYPIVVFEKSRVTKKVTDVRFVFCESGTYEMEFSSDVIVNFEDSGQKLSPLY
ncbi:hypothetical protein [Halobacteriovorax marinus]|uniref:hypothetical protein n=1 Tax=Halobacteriovorax marinus TaxID=97084 RepID=UPI003A93C17F